MARWASLIDSSKALGPTLLVDTGDFWQPTYAANWEVRDRFFFEGFKLMRYDAIGVGEHDLHRGAEKLLEIAKANDLRLVSTNLLIKKTGKRLASPHVIAYAGGTRSLFGMKGGVKVGIFEVILPLYVYNVPARRSEYTVEDPQESARAAVAALRKKGCGVIIAISHLGWKASSDLAASVPGIDVVLNAHRIHNKTYGEMVGQTLVVDCGERQTSFTLVTADFTANGRILEAHEMLDRALKAPDRADLIAIEHEFEAEMRRRGSPIIYE